MSIDHARVLGEALATAVVFRSKRHFDQSCYLLAETLTASSGAELAVVDQLAAELVCLSAFIAIYVVDVEFVANPQYKSEVLREFDTHYLESCQDDDQRSELKDRFARYAAALSTRGAHEREDDVLARAFANVCERNEYEFWSVASDIITQELVVMRGVIRQCPVAHEGKRT